MNAHFNYPDLNNNFKQTHLERPVRADRQIDKIRNVGALRLVKVLASSIRQGVGRISRWIERRSAIHTLQALNDHYLKDIGMVRSQIVSSVNDSRGD